MTRLAMGLVLLVALAGSAEAKSITAEVQYFKSIDVRFSENADVCGYKDPNPYVDHVKKRLSAMDIPENPDALTRVVVYITSTARGLLKRDCIAHAEIQLQIPFEASFLDINSYQGEDQIFTMFSKRSHLYPVTFFESGVLFGESHSELPDETIKALDIILDRLEQSRIER